MSDVRSFIVEGAVKDPGHLIHKQPFEEARLRDIMLNTGYVPVLDDVPEVETALIQKKGTFRYKISMRGRKVDNPWLYEGYLSGRLIPATPGTKLRQLSKQLA